VDYLIPVIIAVILIALIIRLIDRRSAGEIGEDRVSGILQKLPKEEYTVINDITIKNRSGTSQIDHLVISPYGLFVIETKCYQGWLFGSEENEKWTQSLYTEKFQFYNPIQQNRLHIKALKFNLAKYPKIPYYSIIVLAGSCEFKTFEQVKTPVIYDGDLPETIFELSKQKVLTEKQVADIRDTIQNIAIKEDGYREVHVMNAREKAVIAENEINNGTCPRCDGYLVERSGKYGSFYGCSNYPKCKFTKKMK